MRIFFVLLCSFALACVVAGAQEENKSKKPAPKKNQAQSVQQGTTGVGHQPGGGPQKTKGPQYTTTAQGNPAGTGGQKTKGKAKGSQQVTAQGGQTTGGGGGIPVGTGGQKTKGKAKGSQQVTAQGGQTTGGAGGIQKTKSGGAAVQSSTKPFKPQQFNLPNKVNPAIASTTFQANRRIEGSQNWQGSNYAAFRNYNSEWHDQGWWRQRYNRVGLFGGGWYYWNAGFWFPAWGYDQANSYYPYDGPIYGYNNLPPDQVIANVQTALQQQGYYQGEVDGLLGPLTRAAVADYQRANGLAETAAIDQPTLELLGMS